MPRLKTARRAPIKFLSQQGQHSSGTEPFENAERPDVFTFHFGKGRGVSWEDKRRRLLWLCAFDDVHDRGYEHAEQLQANGRLYPELEHNPSAADECALAPWGSHIDEDVREWARAIYGALATWEINASRLAAGEVVSYPSPLHLELSKSADEIWTLTIRRSLAYLNREAEQRQRWLTNGELSDLFRQLAGQPDEDDYEFENPPHPQAYMFAQVHFLNGVITPSEWIRQVCEQAIAGHPPPLVT